MDTGMKAGTARQGARRALRSSALNPYTPQQLVWLLEICPHCVEARGADGLRGHDKRLRNCLNTFAFGAEQISDDPHMVIDIEIIIKAAIDEENLIYNGGKPLRAAARKAAYQRNKLRILRDIATLVAFKFFHQSGDAYSLTEYGLETKQRIELCIECKLDTQQTVNGLLSIVGASDKYFAKLQFLFSPETKLVGGGSLRHVTLHDKP